MFLMESETQGHCHIEGPPCCIVKDRPSEVRESLNLRGGIRKLLSVALLCKKSLEERCVRNERPMGLVVDKRITRSR